MRRALVVALVMACRHDTSVSIVQPVSASPTADALYASVEIHTDGRLLFEKAPMRDDGELTAHARAAVAKQPNFPAAQIRADRAVRYERVIDTLDALRNGGVTDVFFGMPLD